MRGQAWDINIQELGAQLMCVDSFTWIGFLQLLLLAQQDAKLLVLHTGFMYRTELYSLQMVLNCASTSTTRNESCMPKCSWHGYTCSVSNHFKCKNTMSASLFLSPATKFSSLRYEVCVTGDASVDVEQLKLSVMYSPGFMLHTSH
ncbi:hypothetical protein OIU74_005889 [Salix koriyanagi]|uniref:Uncharacterized protein n=1 Tax=Salix koriyanagi TaxID=2511006 RepID=A0A9Q0UD49_9ROSI|nr:hypothetical protein OIU74_005889 [Salix koriyanagi]